MSLTTAFRLSLQNVMQVLEVYKYSILDGIRLLGTFEFHPKIHVDKSGKILGIKITPNHYFKRAIDQRLSGAYIL